MATTAASKTKKPAASVKAAKTVGKKVGKKLSNGRRIGGIIGAIAAPVALLAIGYALTKIDPKAGHKVMGMVFNR
jgi:dolichol kinase